MAELNNVIEHLQIISTWAELDGKMGRGMEPKCCLRIAEWVDDALETLKEQEPVKPLDENYWKHTMGRCGHCKAPLPAIEGLRSKFCWMCGRAVKWDG